MYLTQKAISERIKEIDVVIELLDARRSELANRRQALQVRSAQYQSTIGLTRALGGGWGTTPV